MVNAVDFLFFYMRWLMNLVTFTSWNLGSGSTTLFLGFAFLISVEKVVFLFLAAFYIFNGFL